MTAESRTPPPSAATPGPLTPEHLHALADARHRAKRVRRAATVAAVSGWSMAVFAGLTLLGVALGSMTSLVVSLALGVIAWNELRGGAMLRRLDPRGAARLGFNQIVLGVLIVAYAAWSLYRSLGADPLASVGGSTGDPQMDAMVADLSQSIAYGLYASIAFIGVLVPGLTSWYYFSRGRVVRAFVAQTPAWVLEAMRASV